MLCVSRMGRSITGKECRRKGRLRRDTTTSVLATIASWARRSWEVRKVGSSNVLILVGGNLVCVPRMLCVYVCVWCTS